MRQVERHKIGGSGTGDDKLLWIAEVQACLVNASACLRSLNRKMGTGKRRQRCAISVDPFDHCKENFETYSIEMS